MNDATPRRATATLLHALEAMDAALHEAQARSRDQIFQSAGDQHLARVRRGGHAGADVHGDAAHVVAPQLALAGVQAGADIEAERAQRPADGQRTAHRACGTVEGREEAVARRVNLPAAEAAQLLAYGGVVPLEQVAPGAVAEPGGVLRGATMSVNNTVASTRSSSTTGRAPVRNSSIGASIASTSPA